MTISHRSCELIIYNGIITSQIWTYCDSAAVGIYAKYTVYDHQPTPSNIMFYKLSFLTETDIKQGLSQKQLYTFFGNFKKIA